MAQRDVTTTPDGGVADFLSDVNRAPVPARGRGRVIFALDATASREPTWDVAADVQAQMFVQAQALGGLEVQLVYYRGFDECRASRWVPDAKSLIGLMTSVRCRAGRTQIRRILRHALKEAGKSRVHAVVFIGDSCEEDIDELGHLAGQLGLLGVRAFVFQEGSNPQASRAFAEIARLTGGAHSTFDASSPAQLRDLLAAVAAYASGGVAALQALGARGSSHVKLLARQVR